MSTVCRMKRPDCRSHSARAAGSDGNDRVAQSGCVRDGQVLGQLYAIDIGPKPLTIGHLLAVASIPVAVALYFGRFVSALSVRFPELAGFWPCRCLPRPSAMC